jgi:hypothetical protein
MILRIKYRVLDDQMQLAYADGPVIILLLGLLLQLVEAKITPIQIQIMMIRILALILIRIQMMITLCALVCG